MDAAHRQQPGLAAYVWDPLPAAPTGAYRLAAAFLRATGFLVLALAAVALGIVAASLTHLGTAPTWMRPVFLLSALLPIGWAAVGSWFASHAYYHWGRRARSGLVHAVLLGLGLAWLGGFAAWNAWRGSVAGPLAQATFLLDVAAAAWGLLLLLACSVPAARAPFHGAPG